MKIEDVTARVLSVPMEKPFTAHVGGKWQLFTTTTHVLVEICTDQGHKGFGYALSLSAKGMKALKTMVDELRDFLIGEDPFLGEEILHKIRIHTSFLRWVGLVNFATTAIDVALWDIMGKEAGKPLYRLLGGLRDRVPVYASFDLWRSTTLKELTAAATKLVDMGFRAMKMRAGGGSISQEVERVRAVREAIGKDIHLMVDVNEAWSPPEAIRIGRQFEKYDIYWLEDPVPGEDIEGSAQVAAALDVPIAAGELHRTKADFRQLIERKALDIVMIDLQRVGGISEWRKIAAMAEACHLPVVSHLFPEILCHLVAALPPCLILEYLPLSSSLFTEPLRIEDGAFVLPQKPGLGLELAEEAVAKYEVK
ncbi:MAG TPA: mandelate racemase/muconate lactonizing enzyme family protein [Dehalococcoidia bacterium]|jgi:L-alanine-DL-glutamate epimerase-like enolase superfamily enzyme|nr:mandelate racemase/muconate lactonizing enzyme family protein [Dehalococcoidia bacterium]